MWHVPRERVARSDALCQAGFDRVSLPEMRAPSLLALLASLALCAASCSSTPTHIEQLGRAMLTGKVRLVPDAALPRFAPFDLSREPLMPDARAPAVAAAAACAEANERARHPVRATADGLLSGVVVTASDFTGVKLGAPIEPRRHRVTIRGCALQPPLLAARAGDWLELYNADAIPYSPQIGPATRAHPLEPGKRVRVPLDAGRVTSVLCPPSRPCGRTDVVVFHHPLFAVTDAAGNFRIDGFPHGEMVRVTAWHPLFESSETFVWLEPGDRGAVELWLAPKKRFTTAAREATE
jgi:hypothetical protein